MPAPEKSLGGNGWLVSEAIRAILIAKENVAVSVTGTANETTLYSVTIPKELLGKDGILRVTTLWNFTNSANNKTLKIKLGATTFLTQVTTTNATFHHMLVIRNRNNEALQVAAPSSSAGFGLSTNALITGAVDTAQDQILAITGQLANAGETINLESVLVEVL